MKVSKKEVEHVAKLARLNLSEEEKDLYTEQFNHILDYIHRMNELDLGSIQETPYVQPSGGALRKDEARKSPPEFLKEVLEEAPEGENGFFKVPPVLE